MLDLAIQFFNLIMIMILSIDHLFIAFQSRANTYHFSRVWMMIEFLDFVVLSLYIFTLLYDFVNTSCWSE